MKKVFIVVKKHENDVTPTLSTFDSREKAVDSIIKCYQERAKNNSNLLKSIQHDLNEYNM